MPSQRRNSADKPGEDAAGESPGPRILKKYPNRRLYDTHTSSYITLADVKAMVLEGAEFEVRDAKTGEDLTRSILLQIILEEESGGLPMFSTEMLSQIIRFYGHAMQGLMGAYLEKNMQAFVELQGRFMEQSRGMFDPRSFTPEMWTQFLAGQGPMMQNMVGGYLEQTRKMFENLQEQLSRSGAMFPGFPPGRK